jgi:hypothetical protein
MIAIEKRWNENLVWLLGLLAVGLSLGAAYTLEVSPKVFGGIYFALFGGLGVVSTLFTDAGRGKASAAFATAAVVFGVVVYLIIHSALKKAGAAAGHEGAGSTIGSAMGTIYGIAYFADALVAGIGGVFLGRKIQRGMAGTAARAQSRGA